MTPVVSKTVAPDVDLNELDGKPDDDKVLDLTDVARPRRLVKLPTKKHPEGETFELRTLDDFGIEQQQRLLSLQRRYQKLMAAQEELSDSDAEKLRHAFEQLFDLVLDAPKVAKRDMPDAVKGKVVNAFIVGPLLARQEAQMEIINRLVDRGEVKQEAVDEIMGQLRRELIDQMRETSTSGS